MRKLLKILLEMKKARLKRAEGYYFNSAMQIESELIRAEIAVLEVAEKVMREKNGR